MWTTEQTSALIEAYQKFPCLYFVKDKSYHNKYERSKAWGEIVTALRPIRPSTNEAEIQKKIAGLRTTFSQEKKKVLASMHSGMEEEAKYIPSLWYYEKMNFLSEHASARQSKSSFSLPDQIQSLEASQVSHTERDEEENEMLEDFVVGDDLLLNSIPGLTEDCSTSSGSGTANTPQRQNLKRVGGGDSGVNLDVSLATRVGSAEKIPPTPSGKSTSSAPPKKKMNKKSYGQEKDDIHQVTEQLGAFVNTLNNPQNNVEKSADDVFGEFVAVQLKEITNARLKAEVRYQIHSVLHEALLNQMD